MKRSFTTLMATAAIVLMPSICMAQTENPRGVYKLTGLLDKYGHVIKEPFDQYKICTDSVTLMFNVVGDWFSIGKNDSKVFNYTGEEPDANNATATRIFDSNAERFTLKWWSTYSDHVYFPKNDWCTEYYESGKYSETAKKALDALMFSPASDPKNPLIGTWRLIGMMDELRNMKQEMKRIREKPLDGSYTVFTPSYIVAIARNSGSIYPSPNPYNKNVFKVGKTENKIIWLSKDLIAVEIRQDYRTDYEILERMPSGTVFDKIASRNVIH